MERLTLTQIAVLLGYKDLRSVRKWCLNNNVAVLSDNGKKIKYVMQTEFEAVRLKPFTKYLKERYGKDWLTMFYAYLNKNVAEIINFNESRSKKCTNGERKVSNHQGNHEKKFLEDLKRIIPGI